MFTHYVHFNFLNTDMKENIYKCLSYNLKLFLYIVTFKIKHFPKSTLSFKTIHVLWQLITSCHMTHYATICGDQVSQADCASQHVLCWWNFSHLNPSWSWWPPQSFDIICYGMTWSRSISNIHSLIKHPAPVLTSQHCIHTPLQCTPISHKSCTKL